MISSVEKDLQNASLGARSHITKPIDRQLLLEEVGAIFEGDSTGKLALVVDDDPDARDLVSRTLVSMGLAVSSAENGQQALDKMKEAFDLIVLDLSMPVMNGFEFLAEFNQLELEPRPHVIVFSGMTLDDSLRETLTDLHAGLIDKNEGRGTKITANDQESDSERRLTRETRMSRLTQKLRYLIFIFSASSSLFPFFLVALFFFVIVVVGMGAYFVGLFSMDSLSAEGIDDQLGGGLIDTFWW